LFLSNMLDTASNGALSRTNPQLFNQLRQELLTSGPIDQQIDSPNQAQQGTPGGTDQPNRQQINDAVQAPFESPKDTSVGTSSMIKSTQISPEAGMMSNLATGAGVRQRLLSPQQQSTQYRRQGQGKRARRRARWRAGNWWRRRGSDDARHGTARHRWRRHRRGDANSAA
jgi:hypothetical protein